MKKVKRAAKKTATKRAAKKTATKRGYDPMNYYKSPGYQPKYVGLMP